MVQDADLSGYGLVAIVVSQESKYLALTVPRAYNLDVLAAGPKSYRLGEGAMDIVENRLRHKPPQAEAQLSWVHHKRIVAVTHKQPISTDHKQHEGAIGYHQHLVDDRHDQFARIELGKGSLSRVDSICVSSFTMHNSAKYGTNNSVVWKTAAATVAELWLVAMKLPSARTGIARKS